MDYDTYGLLQTINRNNHEPSETIQDMNELISAIRKSHEELADNLEDDKNDFADRTNSCKKCGEPLEIIDQWDESRGEMMGREVFETTYLYGCTNCGYIKKD